MSLLIIDKGKVVGVLSDELAESHLSDILSVDGSLATLQVTGILSHINQRIKRKEDMTHVDEL